MKRPKGDQAHLTEFFSAKKQHKNSGAVFEQKHSRFQKCPLCGKSLPLHRIESHAATCIGIIQEDSDDSSLFPASTKDKQAVKTLCQEGAKIQWNNILKSEKNCIINGNNVESRIAQPIPGLFLFEEFVTKEEEEMIIQLLDGERILKWKQSSFGGKHFGKKWGVDCSLRDRKVYAEQHPLPGPIQKIIQRVTAMDHVMKGCIPNEANAIDYRREKGDYLKSHVDDRQLSKEPIANLSLAGDCFMTYRLEKKNEQNLAVEKKILLKRRMLQVLTGRARYDYSHGIKNEDLLSERRISVTMRESPLSER